MAKDYRKLFCARCNTKFWKDIYGVKDIKCCKCGRPVEDVTGDRFDDENTKTFLEGGK